MMFRRKGTEWHPLLISVIHSLLMPASLIYWLRKSTLENIFLYLKCLLCSPMLQHNMMLSCHVCFQFKVAIPWLQFDQIQQLPEHTMTNWKEAIINEGFLWFTKEPQIANNEYSISKKAFSVPNAIREAEILSKILTLLNTFELSKWLQRLSRKTPSTSATYMQSGIFMYKRTSDETSQNHIHLPKEMRNVFIFSKGSHSRSNQCCLYYWKVSDYKRLEVVPSSD